MGLLTKLYLRKHMVFKTGCREERKTKKFIYNHAEPNFKKFRNLNHCFNYESDNYKFIWQVNHCIIFSILIKLEFTLLKT